MDVVGVPRVRKVDLRRSQVPPWSADLAREEALRKAAATQMPGRGVPAVDQSAVDGADVHRAAVPVVGDPALGTSRAGDAAGVAGLETPTGRWLLPLAVWPQTAMQILR